MPGKTIFKVLLNPILTKIEVSIFDLVHMIGAHQHTDLTKDCDTDKEIPTEDDGNISDKVVKSKNN